MACCLRKTSWGSVSWWIWCWSWTFIRQGLTMTCMPASTMQRYIRSRELVEDAHKPLKTIEALAELIVSMLWTKYSNLEHITVTVHKPGAPVAGIFRDVSVTLER